MSYIGITVLSEQLADKWGVSKEDAFQVVKDVFDTLHEELLKPNEGLQLINFITLKKKERKPKVGRNPKNGVQYSIPQQIGIKAELGKKFAEDLNRAYGYIK